MSVLKNMISLSDTLAQAATGFIKGLTTKTDATVEDRNERRILAQAVKQIEHLSEDALTNDKFDLSAPNFGLRVIYLSDMFGQLSQVSPKFLGEGPLVSDLEKISEKCRKSDLFLDVVLHDQDEARTAFIECTIWRVNKDTEKSIGKILGEGAPSIVTPLLAAPEVVVEAEQPKTRKRAGRKAPEVSPVMA